MSPDCIHSLAAREMEHGPVCGIINFFTGRASVKPMLANSHAKFLSVSNTVYHIGHHLHVIVFIVLPGERGGCGVAS